MRRSEGPRAGGDALRGSGTTLGTDAQRWPTHGDGRADRPLDEAVDGGLVRSARVLVLQRRR